MTNRPHTAVQELSPLGKDAISGLTGWFAGDIETGQPGFQTQLRDMALALNSADALRSIAADTYACVSTDNFAACGHSGIASICGTPQWKQPYLADIAAADNNACALARAYQDYGSQFMTHIGGAFCCVVIDVDAKRILLSVDRLGQLPMYFHAHSTGISFGSTIAAVTAQASVAETISLQGIYDFVYFHMLPSPTTIFKDIARIPNGHYLEYQNGNCSVTAYWRPTFNKTRQFAPQQAADELRSLLKNAVHKATVGKKHVGAFLSGGLDSSTVTGMLCEVRDEPARAYAIGFAAEGYDEMAYARLTAKHFGATLNEYYVTPDDVVTALPEIARGFDQPFGNSSALPAWFCAKMAAADGIECLLAGDGGDELFAGNERYAKQGVFRAYAHIPLLVRQYLVEPLITRVPAQVPYAGKAQSYIKQANTPLPDRLQAYNFLHRHAATELFDREFLAQIDIENPLGLLRETYSAPATASELDKMLFLDWRFTLADNDLQKVGSMCAHAGVDVRYPMLDDDLLEFSCGIPDRWKLRGRKLRYFYKQGLAGWLPDETLAKSKQGFGLPFGVWMQTHQPLQELAYDSLLKMKMRPYFKPAFIDHLIELHREGHAAYYGELIWVLMILELWLDSHHQGKVDKG